MRDLTDLIGKEIVYYYTDYVNDEQEEDFTFKCKILDCRLETYYFETKNECMNITLSLEPIEWSEELNDRFSTEIFHYVSLDNIRNW